MSISFHQSKVLTFFKSFADNDPSMDIVEVSDASNYGVGVVISHVFPDSEQKEIAYVSRSLTPAECN